MARVRFDVLCVYYTEGRIKSKAGFLVLITNAGNSLKIRYNREMQNVVLEVLTAPGCTHCHEFLEYWKAVGKDWSNVSLKEISLTTKEGQELVQKHQIFASPGIILNGELFAVGGVNKDKFLAKLKELSVE